MGVGRDAAGRALGLLRRRGLVEVEQARRAGGHFTATRYVIRIDVVTETAHPRPRVNHHTHAPTPTLFDTPTTDTDHDTTHDTRHDPTELTHHRNETPGISHTLAFSNAPAVGPGVRRVEHRDVA